MLELSWAYFSLLGASWAHLARRAAHDRIFHRFGDVLGRSGLDFQAFWARPGRFLEAPKPYFSMLFRASEHTRSEGS